MGRVEVMVYKCAIHLLSPCLTCHRKEGGMHIDKKWDNYDLLVIGIVSFFFGFIVGFLVFL